ncbi:MAG: hypothetical protein EZS28_001832, partial [Streblomastix strix]
MGSCLSSTLEVVKDKVEPAIGASGGLDSIVEK